MNEWGEMHVVLFLLTTSIDLLVSPPCESSIVPYFDFINLTKETKA